MQKFTAELWHFILYPQPLVHHENKSLKNKRSDIYNAIGWYFIVGILLYLPVNFINTMIEYFFSINLFKVRDGNMKHSLIGINALLTVALIGPVVEETLFRLWLVLNKTNLLTSLIIIFWVIISRVSHYSIYSGKINDGFFYNFIIASVIAGLIFFLLNSAFFKNLFRSNFRWFYWGSSIAFGLIHILNLSPTHLNIFWAYPFFVLPQLLLGFILGFIRVKNGFYWGLLLHCLVNLPGALQLFFKH